MRSYIERLGAGESAQTVLHEMRTQYRTPQSLATKTCAVRRQYDGPMDEEGARAAESLRELARTPPEREQVDAFVAAYGRTPWETTDNARLDERARVIAGVLLPKNVRMVAVSADEGAAVKRDKRTRLVNKHKRGQFVDGDGVLAHAGHVVRHATRHGLYEVTLALLLVTGRRMAEILNGASSFERIDEHTCRFGGQLKTRTRHAAYVIPTLEDPTHVNAALEHVRRKQPPTVADETNACISRRYQSGLRQHLRKHAVYGEQLTKVHMMRGVYAVAAYHLFDWRTWMLPAVVMHILGHVSPEESLAYTALDVRLTCTRGARGVLDSIVGDDNSAESPSAQSESGASPSEQRRRPSPPASS